LIISAPGMDRGTQTQKPVELLDLYPTLADLCGLKAPETLEGKSLKPLLRDPDFANWNKPAVTQVWHSRNAWGYSLRNERWRYTEWLQGKAGRELYDHASDPNEVHNLADSQEHQALVIQLSKEIAPFVRLMKHKRED